MKGLMNVRIAEFLAAAIAVSVYAANTRVKPGDDFISAMTKASAGDTVYFEPGRYQVPYTEGKANTITLSKSGTAEKPIVFYAAGHATAVIDFQFPELTYVDKGVGLSMTGSYYELHGLGITRAGYQGAYVTGSYNKFYNMSFFENRNSGLEINKGGNHTLVVNVDAYRNYDPKKKGGMADGFASKQTQGAGNVFINCRAWENSDDGFDFFDSPDSVIVYDSWAFRNGINVFGYAAELFEGNGNGFKMGGNKAQANHRCTRCIAFDNPVKGFDQNNNTGGITVEQSIGYRNGSSGAANFALGGTLNAGQKHHLRNNISYKGKNADSYGSSSEQKTNSWNISVTVGNDDFESLDTSLATIARNADGGLPYTKLFRLKAGSDLIDKGTNIGFDYVGSAPDLGPYEYGERAAESSSSVASSSSAASSSSVAESSSSEMLSSSSETASSSSVALSSSSVAESSSSEATTVIRRRVVPASARKDAPRFNALGRSVKSAEPFRWSVSWF